MAAQQAGDDPVVEPAVERLVQVLAGRRGADRRAHHHEHGDRHEGEIIEPGIEGLGGDAQRVDALKQDEESNGDGAQAERDRRARQKDDEGDDEDDRALGGGVHSSTPSCDLNPKGGSRPDTSFTISTTYCRVSSAKPIGIDE
jgi:hypothetical protein